MDSIRCTPLAKEEIHVQYQKLFFSKSMTPGNLAYDAFHETQMMQESKKNFNRHSYVTRDEGERLESVLIHAKISCNDISLVRHLNFILNLYFFYRTFELMTCQEDNRKVRKTYTLIYLNMYKAHSKKLQKLSFKILN